MKVTDTQIREAVAHSSSLNAAAELLGLDPRGVARRAKNLGIGLGSLLPAPAAAQFEIKNGVILVGGDAHWWPGQPMPTATAAFIRLAREFTEREQLAMVAANGDLLDAPTISVHPQIGWEKRPELAAELEVVKDYLGQIQEATNGIPTLWMLGNHDARFETNLAKHASEYKGVPGFTLKEHFPAWTPCWAGEINSDLIIKHRWKGGKNAPLNNTIEAGRSIVTGHLHSLNVAAYSDYDGVRWGVDGGMLGCPYAPQFVNYTELAPVNWRAGFAVLTIRNHRLLWPEVCHVIDETTRTTSFRGVLTTESL